jgi:hypothetical protein
MFSEIHQSPFVSQKRKSIIPYPSWILYPRVKSNEVNLCNVKTHDNMFSGSEIVDNIAGTWLACCTTQNLSAFFKQQNKLRNIVMQILFFTFGTLYIYANFSRDPNFHNPFSEGAYTSLRAFAETYFGPCSRKSTFANLCIRETNLI